MKKIPFLAEAIGIVAKNIREESGLTTQKFADFSQLSQSYVSLLENGDRNATLNTLYLLAEATQIPTHELVKRIEEERQSLLKTAERKKAE